MKKGFTLIELLVVIAIIGILATLIIVNVSSARVKARDARRKADIRQIQGALALYYEANSQYPASGGATFPNAGWSNSADTSWTTLSTALSPYITLPKDPRNESGGWAGWPGSLIGDKLNYSYYSLGYGCPQQWYMLVYKLERDSTESPGVTACNGTNFNYTGTITVGVSGVPTE